MSDKRRKTLLKVVFWLSALVAGLFLFANLDRFSVNPFKSVDLTAVLTARMDSEGSVYVIDDGATRIIKTDPTGAADYVLRRGQGFSYAQDIAAGAGPVFYVHDIVWDGLRVRSESIKAFAQKTGKLIGIVFELTYGRRQSFPCIKAMGIRDGGVWFIQTDARGFTLKYADAAGDVRTGLRHSYPEASRALEDFSVSGDRILILDKAGAIMSWEAGQLSSVYTPVSGNDITEFRLPFSLAQGQFLYYADIGRRSIGVIDQGKSRDFVSPDLSVDLSQRPIYYSVDVQGDSVVFTDKQTVHRADTQGNVAWAKSVLAPGPGWVALRIVLLAAVVVAAGGALYGFVALTAGMKLTLTSKQQTTLVVILVALLVSVIITPALVRPFEREAKAEMLNRLSTLNVLSRNILDGDALASIRTPQDYRGESYMRLRASLEAMFDDNFDWNDNIYAALYKRQGNDVYAVMFLDGSMGAFYPYGEVFAGSNFEAVEESGGLVTEDNIADTSGFYMAVTGPIADRNGQVAGTIEVGINLQAFNDDVAAQIRRAVVSVVLMVSILVFVLVEGVDASHTFRERRRIRWTAAKLLLPVPYVRILSFVVLLAFNLTTGFLPIYAGRFKAALWGVSPTVSAALALVINHVLMAIGASLCAGFLRRFDARSVFAGGVVLAMMGEIITGLSPSFAVLVLGLSVSGFGGGALLAFLSVYVGSLGGTQEKAEGFALLNAASFSGMNCGVLIGAALAVVVGQSAVFFFSALLWLGALRLFAVLLNKQVPRVVGSVNRQSGLSRFLASRAVRLHLIMFFTYVTLNGFLFFFVPVFCAAQGLPETEISLMFILHAVSLTVVGPLVARKFRSMNLGSSPGGCGPLCGCGKCGERREAPGLRGSAAVLAGSLALSVVALLAVAFSPGIVSVAVAVLVLGCSNGVGHIYYPLFFSELEEAKAFGIDRAMSLHGTVENAGVVAGPFVFGWAVSAVRVGFVAISALSATVTLAFLILTARRPSGAKEAAPLPCPAPRTPGG